MKLLAGEPRPDLARICLEIARDFAPGLEIEDYLKRIDDLAGRVRERCPSGMGPLQILNQIHWVMHVEEGYEGNRDDYYDASNSYLNEVIDRKIGIPITLCILYSAVASRVGLHLSGLDLPAHFMLKLETVPESRFIDPFHGQILDQSGCEKRLTKILGQPVRLTSEQLSDCPPARIIARVLRNLKAVHLQEGDLMAVLLVQRRLSALGPEDPRELRELGLLSLQLTRLDEGVAALQQYLRLSPNSDDRDFIETLIRDGRREIALRN